MDKYIFHKKKALDYQSCNHIIDLFEKSNPTLRKEHDYYGIYPHITGDLRFSFIKPLLTKYIDEYVEKHRFLQFVCYQWDIEEMFNIQKYNPGQYYDSMHSGGEGFDVGHMEHGAEDWNNKRVLGWMFYLNDIKKDGGTCWPQQNFTTKPRAGDLYIWPAGWTHSHYGIPAPKEIKYIITGWCSFG